MGHHNEAARKQAVQMYMDGAKLRDITDETGIPRPTIIYYVQQAGLEPNRQGTRRARPQTTTERADTIHWMMQEIERLAAENALLKAQLATRPQAVTD